jgi:hypothetical protein
MAGYIGSKASVVSSGAEHKKTFTITGATTSLTGLNYTVGKVHVFQNGVRLVDGTDYTATNGTTITLTVAAQSGDNVVVISQASYQVALSGIDDQSNATAITIDSDENILAGKTSSAFNTAGFELFGNADKGKFWATRDGGVAAAFNRKSSDGDIALFAKDGTTVGSIGVTNGTNAIFNSQGGTLKLGTVGTERYNFDLDQIYPTVDNDTNLGATSHRFKDAYLSGGIHLGGTGSANKLSDYETGNWTPILGGSTSTSGQTYATQHGSYTKIGRVVHLQAYVVVTSIGTTSGTYGQVQNLPFTAAPVQGYGAGFFQYFNLLGTNVSQLIAYPEGNSTFAYVLYTAGAGTSTTYLGGGGWGSAPQIMFSMTYLTNS